MSAISATAAPAFPETFGHPRPLWMLFMAEFWERFAFYGMRWALTLYIVDQFFGGDPSGQAYASRTYGAYLALVYATSHRRRLRRRSPARLPALDPARRGDHGSRAFHDHGAEPADFHARARTRHHRQRPLQAEHLLDGRPALRRRRSASRPRLHDLLHGHQPRRLRRAAGDRLARQRDHRHAAAAELPRRVHHDRHRHDPLVSLVLVRPPPARRDRPAAERARWARSR